MKNIKSAAKKVVAALKAASINASTCKFTAGFGKVMISGVGVHASIDLYYQGGEEHFAYVGQDEVKPALIDNLAKAFQAYTDAVASNFEVQKGFTPTLHVSRNSCYISVGHQKNHNLELSDLAGLNWHQPNFQRARREI